MTDDEKTPAGTVSTPVLPYRDRTMILKVPGAAQLMMWQRVERQFGALVEKEGDIEPDEYRKALHRLDQLVMSLFTDQADKDWLEDEVLEGNITDKDLLDLFGRMGEVIRAAAPTPNRAARRVKAKKTTSKTKS
ncbi:MAG: hypothetical protein ACRD0W_05695 [Acidimicrobiales bacterium]